MNPTGVELAGAHPSMWGFPDPVGMEPGSDYAGIGADWNVGTLIAAYSAGYFPMPEGDEPGWWCPDPRGVLPLDGMRVTRSLRQSAKKFTVTRDQAFDAVVAACGATERDGGHWINEDVTLAYRRLFDAGIAHSIEVFLDDVLVGGLYGVEVGGLFAGESMFHHARDASKVALLELVRILSSAPDPDRRLLDVQWATDHLESLGVVQIPRPVYLGRLRDALGLPAAFG